MNLRKLFYHLPPGIRMMARRVYFIPHDVFSTFSSNKTLQPPLGKIYTGGGDFIETGNRFVDYFKEFGNLKETHHVLDIGSGIGRMAIPLTKYLSSLGVYNGFDVVKKGVDWCHKNINSKHSNFNFHYIELSNDLYRKDGTVVTDYKFPLDNQSQDFILLISVFTHLVKDDMEHYIKEISRLLKPNSRCFATFFIHDQDQEEVNTQFYFRHRYNAYSLMDKKVKSANVAYNKDYLFGLIEKNGMKITKYALGHWRNLDHSKNSLDFQDILVIEKRN